MGARIRVDIEEDGISRSVYKWVNSGGSFGCNPLRQEIGLGSAKRINLLEIYWPTSDSRQQFQDVAADQIVEITEGESKYRSLPAKSFSFRRKPSETGSQ
jgi:hypothetical protein